jgi:hypothetical protein
MKRIKLRTFLVILLWLVAIIVPLVAEARSGPVDPAPPPPHGGPLFHALLRIVLTVIGTLEHLCI